MEAWAWIFFVSSFSILAKHSCQVPPDRNAESLSPVVILQQPSPSSSGISYESLHYPVAAEQQYQVIPLVINTGRIPLINHAVRAPIQYFVPDGENHHRRSKIYDDSAAPRQYISPAAARDGRHLQRPRDPDTILPYYSDDDDAETDENRMTYDDSYNYPPTAAAATVYSETRVDDGGLPASQRRYSYGYKIVDGHRVGGSDDRHDAPPMTIVGGPKISYGPTSRPGESDRVVFEHAIDPGARSLGETAGRRKPDGGSDHHPRRDDGPDDRALKPIVVKTESNATKTELKKHYKKVAADPEKPIEVTNTNGKSKTINPARR